MKYFLESEFVMGSQNVFDKMNTDFLNLLDNLRAMCGFALIINSSYRDPQYNLSVGGFPGSKHMEGIAVDIKCMDSIKRAQIVQYALELGLTVGVSDGFIHVDSRRKQIMFTY